MEDKKLEKAIDEYLRFRKFPVNENNAIFFAELIADFYKGRIFTELNDFQNKSELKEALKEFIENR